VEDGGGLQRKPVVTKRKEYSACNENEFMEHRLV